MALIIRLTNELLASQEDTDANENGEQHSAEVILFPGVRYERWPEAQADQMDASNSNEHEEPIANNRDWLEI